MPQLPQSWWPIHVVVWSAVILRSTNGLSVEDDSAPFGDVKLLSSGFENFNDVLRDVTGRFSLSGRIMEMREVITVSYSYKDNWRS